jgi:hypothetical protein
MPNPESDFAFNLQVAEINGLGDSPANYVTDLQTLIDLSIQEIHNADEELTKLGQEVSQGEGDEAIEEIASRIGILKKQLEEEESRQRELASMRDLNWNAYK